LTGGRGVYRWRGEAVALGEDALKPTESTNEREEIFRSLFDELSRMSPEEIERDVYQLWEADLCRSCRRELGDLLDRFLG
jgi:hypothetical protein